MQQCIKLRPEIQEAAGGSSLAPLHHVLAGTYNTKELLFSED